MSIYIPEKDWFRAPEGGERVWMGMALVWCLVMFVMMPFWHFKGKQNSTGEAYRVTAQDFDNRVKQFVETNTVDQYEVGKNSKGEPITIPIVEPSPGGDAYIRARMWDWYPILKLKEGQSYRIHISSMDLGHGFSLMPINMNFQVSPGYDHVLTMTPTRKGEYEIICNEFCGIGHHKMVGKIIVE
ncbi:MAG: cytochrome C oxidase subunit II [Leptonema sp. (in: Bacteria)]|nr:cytochrome C oxidase subunit II [Leptonema sp. (in: bacteria)]